VIAILKLPKNQLASGSLDTVKIWNLSSGNCIRTIKVNRFAIKGLKLLSEDKIVILTWDEDGAACNHEVWNFHDGFRIFTLENPWYMYCRVRK
jgi:WD40 repeat protein